MATNATVPFNHLFLSHKSFSKNLTKSQITHFKSQCSRQEGLVYQIECLKKQFVKTAKQVLALIGGKRICTKQHGLQNLNMRSCPQYSLIKSCATMLAQLLYILCTKHNIVKGIYQIELHLFKNRNKRNVQYGHTHMCFTHHTCKTL